MVADFSFNNFINKLVISYQDEDVPLPLLMEVIGKLRQLTEFDFVVGEVFLVLHVVYVSVLNVLHEDKNNMSVWAPYVQIQPIKSRCLLFRKKGSTL